MKTRMLAAAFGVALLTAGFPASALAQPIVRPAAPPVTGLSGWKIFLDPGHGQNGNVGYAGYSEARKVLAIGLELRRLLLETTDIDTVYISRTTDDVNPDLSQRVDFANATGSDFFLSIHSNAAGPEANNLFVLWPQYQDRSEAVPNGGKRMAQLLANSLADGMRIPKSNGGIWGECDFYGVSSCRANVLSSGKGGSRNYVQSYTNMASALGEAGFHTNPTQNQRNMNADWKRMEARAEYWGILDFHGLPHPPEQIVTGIVRDIESGDPINGAVVSVGDTTYTTDTWESLFRQFSNDPQALRNGFYYLDGLAGTLHDVTAEAPGFEPYTGSVEAPGGVFTHHDIGLVSTLPPTVATTTPTAGQDPFRVTDAIQVTFSRPMERAATEAAFSLEPSATGTFSWTNGDRRLIFRPDSLRARTFYTLRIAEIAVGAYGHPFDGDADGAAGGVFAMSFTTGFPDTKPAAIAGSFPRQNARDVALRPVVTFVYDEPLDSTTVFSRVRLERTAGAVPVAGEVRYWRVRERGVVSFFPSEPLAPGTAHRFIVAPGVADLFLNPDPNQKTLSFTTGSLEEDVTPIDNFETGVTTNWWQPQQSGSTTGIVTTQTSMAADTQVTNALFGGSTAMRLSYGWDATATEPLIRQYLGGGAPRSLTFDSARQLRAWVFGDGSGTKFRFAIDDNVPATAASNHEVSPWTSVDWYGWQPVTWAIYDGQTGTWIGDGTVTGTLRIDSIQLTRADAGTASGTIWIDDLQLIDAFSTAGESAADLPGGYVLEQNWPNPFNPTTTIAFALPAASRVRLVVYDVLGRQVSVLVDGLHPAGRHEVRFDATGLATGMYVARLETPSGSATRTMTLVR